MGYAYVCIIYAYIYIYMFACMYASLRECALCTACVSTYGTSLGLCVVCSYVFACVS